MFHWTEEFLFVFLNFGHRMHCLKMFLNYVVNTHKRV